jgi:Na+-driven multidrug efflux pump
MYKFMIVQWGFDGGAYGVALSFIIFTLGNLALLFIQRKKFLKIWRKEI